LGHFDFVVATIARDADKEEDFFGEIDYTAVRKRV